MRSLLAAVLCLPCFVSLAHAQGISPAGLLEQGQRNSSLTVEGQPFHAMLDIGKPGTPFSGRVEVWWSGPTTYRSSIASPQFSRTVTVNAGAVQETDTGDFMPRWLEDFEAALLNPARTGPMFTRGSLSASRSMSSTGKSQVCIVRDDRPGGVTDQLTWGHICFQEDGKSILLERVQTFNSTMEYSDWKGFGEKRIARTYTTAVLDFQPVKATLSQLEPLPAMPSDFFAPAGTASSASHILRTQFVSTLTEESLVERAPVIEWPTVREGKTEGFMIVYARTDRTGQVRETAKRNSDQPGLESFGMQQALQFKFKPLLIDGAPVQMEMPLVLHFKTTTADSLPILPVEEMKKQMSGCRIDPPRDLPFGTSVTIRISVDEHGKMTGAGPVGDVKGTGWLASMTSLRNCRYKPYVVNGNATYYKGDVVLMAP